MLDAYPVTWHMFLVTLLNAGIRFYNCIHFIKNYKYLVHDLLLKNKANCVQGSPDLFILP